MPICAGCSEPCSCLVEEDGFYANRPQDGRTNTVVTGIGTIEDPYTISFMQSEFYEPASAEIQTLSPKIIAPGTSHSVSANEGDSTVAVYQSPGVVLSLFPTASATAIAVSNGNFKVVGASATFATNSTGNRYLCIVGLSPTDFTYAYVIAGVAAAGHANGSLTINCSALSPGIFDPVNIPSSVSNPRINVWGVGLWYTGSGPILSVSNIKFWMSTL